MGSQILHSGYGLAQGFQVYSDVPSRTLRTTGEIEERLAAEVVTEGMKGVFHYLAKEEAAIRRNPAKRTTEILRKVFQGR